MSKPIIKVKDLSFAYARNHNTLEGISFDINPGEHVCILGPNGGGKSTMIKIIAGELFSKQCVLSCSKSDIAYLPQKSKLDPTFPLYVQDVLRQGLKDRDNAAGIFEELLVLTGLQELKKTPIRKLSGGQFQKLLIARLFALDREVYLLDEPFNAVDQKSILVFLHYIKSLRKCGKTVIMVLHDLDLAKQHLSRGLYIDRVLKGDGSVRDALKGADHND